MSSSVILTDERLIMPIAMAREIKAQSLGYGRREACGLIGGARDGTVRLAHLLAACSNISPHAEHNFRIAPWDQYNITQRFVALGRELVACYHSHPYSEAVPSETDVQAMSGHPTLFTIIYSVPRDELRVWRGSHPVDLEVIQ